MKMAYRVDKLVSRHLRARVAAAFRKVARAVDARTAYHKTKDFYRSSSFPWTRYLELRQD